MLGPLLFLCCVNDIFSAAEPASYLFADDTSCLAGNKNLPSRTDFINQNFTSSLTGAIQ